MDYGYAVLSVTSLCIGVSLTLFSSKTTTLSYLEYGLLTSICAVALYICMTSLSKSNLAGNVDLCIVVNESYQEHCNV